MRGARCEGRGDRWERVGYVTANGEWGVVEWAALDDEMSLSFLREVM